MLLLMMIILFYFRDSSGKAKSYKLVPNGANVLVTGQNCEDYVAMYQNFLMNDHVSKVSISFLLFGESLWFRCCESI
jgi:hypothetical protein